MASDRDVVASNYRYLGVKIGWGIFKKSRNIVWRANWHRLRTRQVCMRLCASSYIFRADMVLRVIIATEVRRVGFDGFAPTSTYITKFDCFQNCRILTFSACKRESSLLLVGGVGWDGAIFFSLVCHRCPGLFFRQCSCSIKRKYWSGEWRGWLMSWTLTFDDLRILNISA